MRSNEFGHSELSAGQGFLLPIAARTGLVLFSHRASSASRSQWFGGRGWGREGMSGVQTDLLLSAGRDVGKSIKRLYLPVTQKALSPATHCINTSIKEAFILIGNGCFIWVLCGGSCYNTILLVTTFAWRALDQRLCPLHLSRLKYDYLSRARST